MGFPTCLESFNREETNRYFNLVYNLMRDFPFVQFKQVVGEETKILAIVTYRPRRRADGTKIEVEHSDFNKSDIMNLTIYNADTKRDSEGRTFLHVAMKDRHVEFANKLIAKFPAMVHMKDFAERLPQYPVSQQRLDIWSPPLPRLAGCSVDC